MKNNLSLRIFQIAVPIILQSLIHQFQILIDRAFLGQINSEYFSAVGNVLFPYFATITVITSISMGTVIIVAQRIGAKNLLEAKRYAETAFKYNSLLSFMLFIVWFIFPKVIFFLLGVESPILEYSTRYVKFLSISFIFFGVEISATAVLQGTGITYPIMYAGFLRNGLNILLDWLLIFGNLGFPEMNIEGAALATTISNLIAGPLLLGFVLFSKKIPVKITFMRIFQAKWRSYLEILKIGVPAGLETLLWHLGNLILIRFLNALDIMAAGIYSLLFELQLIPFLIYLGIAQAATTLVGQKTGAKDHKSVLIVGSKCIMYSLIICALGAIVLIFYPQGILTIFTHDTTLINRALPFLIVVSITMFPRSINVVVGHGVRGLGDTRWMLYTQILGTCFVVCTSYVLIFIVNLSMLGLFVAILLDEIIRSAINSLRFYKGRDFWLIGRKRSLPHELPKTEV